MGAPSRGSGRRGRIALSHHFISAQNRQNDDSADQLIPSILEPRQLPELVDVGTYEDTLVKEAGEWRFAKRVITMDASSFTQPGR